MKKIFISQESVKKQNGIIKTKTFLRNRTKSTFNISSNIKSMLYIALKTYKLYLAYTEWKGW